MSAPFYRRIVDDIRARVESGDWPPGTRLPTTRDLRDYYRHRFASASLSLGTVERALAELKVAGVLRGQQGLGIFVEGDPRGETG